MLTMVIEGRRPLFGRLYRTGDDARIELTPLGNAVRDAWWDIPRYHPQVRILDLQMMPDHLHGIIQVMEQMPYDLSRVVRGFKTGCGRAYLKLMPTVATVSQQTMGAHPEHGLLFETGFNDRILKKHGQLTVWRHYLRDNPRRLLMKREHPDLFCVQRGLIVRGMQFSAIGNRFLLDYPELVQVRCSRRLTDSEITAVTNAFVEQAEAGAVLVSPCISRGEKAVMRCAFDRGLPLVILQENGFTDLAKPGGKRMEACASGRLLLLAPWEHHNEQRTITRHQCLELNEMARMICEEERGLSVATVSQQT